MTESESTIPLPAARALIEQILAQPELKFEKKGHRLRSILEHLLELYLADPKARSSERKLAEKFYAEGISAADSAKKALGRLRDYLEVYCESKLSLSHSVRVKIPPADYRLVFYERLKRYDTDPADWFWSAYRDQSLPVRVAFLHPGARWHRKGFSPHATVRLYRSLLNVTGRQAPEPISLRHQGASDQLRGPEHKVVFAAAPFMDTISTQYIYARRNLEMLHWEPPQHSHLSVKESRRAIIDSDGPGGRHLHTFEDDGRTAHVLLTRFTFPKAPFPQLTLLSSYEPPAIEKVMDALTDIRFLFKMVTTDVFAESQWDKSRAPAIFQVVLAVGRQPESSRSAFRDHWGEPKVCLARVFAKDAFVAAE